MLGIYFKYNPETCTYEADLYDSNRTVRIVLILTLTALISATGVWYGIRSFYPTADEQRLQVENHKQRSVFNGILAELDKQEKHLSFLEAVDEQHYRIVLNLEPMATEIRRLGIGGNSYAADFAGEIIPEIKKAYQNLRVFKSRLGLEQQSFKEIISKAEETETMLQSRPAMQPIEERMLTRFHPAFGLRVHPVFGDYRFHHGLDLTADIGTPVYATGDGIVSTADVRGGYGNAVFIEHGFGFETRYAHLSKYIVKQGDRIKRGQLIGYVGNTGISSGPHLHYEVLFHEKWVNPIHFMYRNLGQSALKISKR
jgi:murein DD-endopeptidase MepM/ murein hydrolase activator NlpD